ncbi:hypothetical protein L6164_013441 [Bauhinia variegata]|uniref:Uncharacterized protein n=1 Tax=Bauhinia variegata TaxID=167791 RepID=A0ACB9NG77_BAUVA|nr:hypothetical protein L6164_013441 [Bauhinia variegata]
MSSLRVVGALLVLFVCLISSMAMGFDAEVGNGSSSSVQCKKRERQALLTLKQGLRDYCGVLTSWGNTGENHDECCKWEGVHCSHKTGHVIMLDLRGRPDYASCLEGTINSSLIELRYLSYLDFSFNFFHGGVPKFIDSFTHLKYLNLSYSFYGNNGIPFELGNLLHLQYLDLQANRLGGEFPTHFLNLSRLVHLNLAGNQLTGEIPDIFANISSLVYLDLSWNFFTGTIPHSLGNLLQLNYLDLSSSSSTANLDWLSDLTPNLDRLSDLTSNLDWLSNLTSMKTLKLASVNLGTVINWQQKLSNLSHLQELDLSGCNLVSSKFPLLFNHSANLAILQLSDNDLTGSIPKSLLNICNLSVLDLSYNSMSGRFDDFVSTSTNCANKSLQHLLLRENQMIGSVPDLSQFSFLQELDLQGNNLSGPIPKSMFDICRLSVLNLRDNNLNGRLDDFIPTSTDCAYKSLQQLLLGQNQITASAPNLSQFSSLQILDLYDNNLSGPIPKSLLNICSLRELDLSSNILSGRLDDFVSTTPGCAKKSLQHLSLIGNQITGTVPHLSQFSSLQDLFLANNRLNGTVLVIAVLLKMFMKRRFPVIQWEALALLLIGISVNQLRSLPEGTTALGLPVTMGAYIYTSIFVTVPSLASVYNEYALKSQYDTSIYLQTCVYEHMLECPSSFDILQGHSKATMLLIANNAAQGILSSFFFKYADTILKKYSSTVVTIFTGIASAALFGHTLTMNFILDISIVFISMHQFFSPLSKVRDEPQNGMHDIQDSHRSKDAFINMAAGANEEKWHSYSDTANCVIATSVVITPRIKNQFFQTKREEKIEIGTFKKQIQITKRKPQFVTSTSKHQTSHPQSKIDFPKQNDKKIETCKPSKNKPQIGTRKIVEANGSAKRSQKQTQIVNFTNREIVLHGQKGKREPDQMSMPQNHDKFAQASLWRWNSKR